MATQSPNKKATQARAPSPIGAALGAIAAAALIAAILLGFDRLFAVLADPDARGLTIGRLIALLGAHTVVAGAVVAATLLLGAVARLLARVWPRRKDGPAPRYRGPVVGLLAGAAAAAPFDRVAQDLVSGEWIQGQGYAPMLRTGLTVVLCFGVFVIVWCALADWPRKSGFGRWLFVALALFGAFGCSAIDAFMLPGLYPYAHLSLYAYSALLATVGVIRLLDIRVRRVRAARYIAVAALASIAICLMAFSQWWTMDPSSRAAVAQASPLARQLLPVMLPDRKEDSLRQVLVQLDVRSGTLESRHDPSVTARVTNGKTDFNVVLIVVDTFRNDSLGPWRREGGASEAGDTPFIDEWLRSAYRFKNAYSQASKTKASMPPMFHSGEPHEDPNLVGDSLPVRMSALGRMPMAIVPQYFLIPVKDSAQGLLDGFEQSAFVEKDAQSELPAKVVDVLKRKDDRPLFAWIHFYMMHAPYYADRLTTGADGSTRDRYRMALRALDAQMRSVVEAVEKSGGADRTIYVLTADHGENLGDNRLTGHGATVLEEEVHIPFAIWVPNAPGGDVEATVGNIDVVPTLIDLLGGRPDASLRGQSLVPLMDDPAAKWDRSYLVGNGSLAIQGIVKGRDKLFYNRKSKLFYRYDLKRDPQENTNLFADGPLDRSLVGELFRHNPSLAKAQLEDKVNRDLVSARLADVDANEPGSSLPLLLQLMELTPTPQSVAEAERIFRQTTSTPARLRVAKHLAKIEPKRTVALLKAYLDTASDADAAAFVLGLGQQGQPPFAEETVRQRMQKMGPETEPEVLNAWLTLVMAWPKTVAKWGSVFQPWLSEERALSGPPLQALLENCAGLQVKRMDQARRDLTDAIAAKLEQDDPEVRRAAVEAIGNLGDASDGALLREVLSRPSATPRVRQAILHALGRLLGKEAVETIVSLGDDPLLTVDAIVALEKIKDPAAIPFLKKIQDTHYNAYTKSQARNAIRTISAKGKPRGKPTRVKPKPPVQPTPTNKEGK